MKILALELSSARGSVAWRDGGEPFVLEWANDRKHSGRFFEVLQLCAARFGHADRIVVGLGPGSYAGTRIAIAAATGLRTAGGATLTGISSMRAIATDVDDYVVIGDARRQSFYFARVQQRRCTAGPELCDEDELRQRLETWKCPTYTTAAIAAFPSATVRYPSASVLAQLAAAESLVDSKAALEPIYLRDPHITQPKAIR